MTIEHKQKLVKMSETVEVLCNKCSKSCNTSPTLDWPSFEYVEGKVTWGYHSGKDMQQHIFHLCEVCYDELRKTFSIPPEIYCFHEGCEYDHSKEFSSL